MYRGICCPAYMTVNLPGLIILGRMQLVSTGADTLMKLWSVKTSECTATFDAHEGKVGLTRTWEQWCNGMCLHTRGLGHGAMHCGASGQNVHLYLTEHSSSYPGRPAQRARSLLCGRIGLNRSDWGTLI